MRHKNGLRKLGRTSSHRNAMLKNMVSSLFLTQPSEDGMMYERIITTPQKAKEARRLAEKSITLGKKGTLAARRRAIQILGDRNAVKKLFDTIAPRYQTRPGGYTRILGYPSNRLGDNAQQVIFELVGPYGEGAAEPVQPAVTAETAQKPEQAEETKQQE